MSEKNPECPLHNPSNCKEYCNPKVCAFVKKDKICLKKRKPGPSEKHPSETIESNNDVLEICQVKLPE